MFSAVMFTDSTALAAVIVIKLYPPHLSSHIYALLGIQRWHKSGGWLLCYPGKVCNIHCKNKMAVLRPCALTPM
jgi:hypothetical protein